MLKEIWKPINFTNGKYEASSFGRIRRSSSGKSTKIGKILSPYIQDKLSYSRHYLFYNNKNNAFMTHRLITYVFFGEIKKGFQVNHKDGNKFNNNIDNLEYVTQTENMQHRINILGIKIDVKGSKNGFSKFTENDVINIRKLCASGINCKQVAKIYNVHRKTINNIKNRKAWAHI